MRAATRTCRTQMNVEPAEYTPANTLSFQILEHMLVCDYCLAANERNGDFGCAKYLAMLDAVPKRQRRARSLVFVS